ncbi:MAG: ABC transporter ATP-binding protein [Candidatus Cloacimonadaceae bacterium]|jgi:iron complex transport system ATP-binding protein|nr:ABC transporter ATP-binding protein [Candidatus Cloacimonadota bacterium]MDY0127839.1 ABC transporter ATP-binding protein [Candidatus Cloacimonadaceae bacterium]MCB5254087.1 ABC transporter ATP-binding protein [Candidatus Cloacimonadota bacterium]MCK9178207.1 ABC transporter ATP-binding protein [Candidatus Cloacimonadota bacterium]MCK9242605.1 ABC transporter ATP-binding protein [Candidatus Cloacimonadota bacterium]
MIQACGLCSGYWDKEVLHNIDLKLSSSGFTALLGPNGSGKSTLIFTLMGYLKARKGHILIRGKDLQEYSQPELAKIIAYIPQEIHSEFDYTVLDTVLMGRYPYIDFLGSYSEEDYRVTENTLSQLDLLPMKHRFVQQLSGGEKQRVYIARALVQETPFIFLDESLSQLDINYQLEIMRLLKKISLDQHKSILLISHNLNLSANYADRLLFLKEGRLLYSGSPNELMQADKLSEIFSVPLSTSLNPLSQTHNIIYP